MQMTQRGDAKKEKKKKKKKKRTSIKRSFFPEWSVWEKRKTKTVRIER